MSVSLHCELDANPPSLVRWIRDQRNPSAESSTSKRVNSASTLSSPSLGNANNQGWRQSGEAHNSLIENSAMNSAQLVFKHVSEQHAGWYRCITDHAFGHYESYGYYLNIRGEYQICEKLAGLDISQRLIHIFL